MYGRQSWRISLSWAEAVIYAFRIPLSLYIKGSQGQKKKLHLILHFLAKPCMVTFEAACGAAFDVFLPLIGRVLGSESRRLDALCARRCTRCQVVVGLRVLRHSGYFTGSQL
jgi:hypothetical protein